MRYEFDLEGKHYKSMEECTKATGYESAYIRKHWKNSKGVTDPLNTIVINHGKRKEEIPIDPKRKEVHRKLKQVRQERELANELKEVWE